MLQEIADRLRFLADVRKLLEILQVEKGNTVIIVEHNPEAIKTADWIIDLGPEGGEEGGELVAEGTVARGKRSYTGRYLKSILARDRKRRRKIA